MFLPGPAVFTRVFVFVSERRVGAGATMPPAGRERSGRGAVPVVTPGGSSCIRTVQGACADRGGHRNQDGVAGNTCPRHMKHWRLCRRRPRLVNTLVNSFFLCDFHLGNIHRLREFRASGNVNQLPGTWGRSSCDRTPHLRRKRKTILK